MPLVAYLILCLIVSVLARKTAGGFWGFFFLSVLLTPILSLIVILMSSRLKPRRPYDV